jgi:hypothetical protein
VVTQLVLEKSRPLLLLDGVDYSGVMMANMNDQARNGSRHVF